MKLVPLYKQRTQVVSIPKLLQMRIFSVINFNFITRHRSLLLMFLYTMDILLFFCVYEIIEAYPLYVMSLNLVN